jgi:hypothetical protein
MRTPTASLLDALYCSVWKREARDKAGTAGEFRAPNSTAHSSCLSSRE